MQLNIQSVKECDLRQNGKQMEVRPHYITRWPVQETCSMYSVPLLMRVTCTACCNVPPSADISETLKSRSQTSKDAEVKWKAQYLSHFCSPQALCRVCRCNRWHQRDFSSWTDEQTPCCPARRGDSKSWQIRQWKVKLGSTVWKANKRLWSNLFRLKAWSCD